MTNSERGYLNGQEGEGKFHELRSAIRAAVKEMFMQDDDANAMHSTNRKKNRADRESTQSAERSRQYFLTFSNNEFDC